MKVVIATSGTRGDVQPYIALGLELVSRGHEVVLATEERMKALVEQLGTGVTYAQVAGDPQGMVYEKKYQKLLAEGKIFPVMKASEAHNQAFRVAAMHDYWAACQGAGLIISAPLCFTPTLCCAEKLGVPWVPVALGPVMPTGDFPSWAISSTPFRFKWANSATYRFLFWALWQQEAGRINAWRKDVLDLPPMRQGLGGVLEASGEIPVIQMCSRFMIPGLQLPADWPPYAHITGSAYLPPTPEEDVEQQLKEFVQAGEKPLYLGFGSMPAPDPRALVELAVQVVTQTGRRAVLCAGWSELSRIIGPEEGQVQLPGEMLLVVASAPHDWLLPRCCAAVHHCGAGTCAAVLRAGVPSIPCPVMLDQPWHALRLVEVGVAVQPIPFHKITAKVLVGAVNSVCSNTAMQQRAREVADSMAKEDKGVKAAADIALGATEPWTKLRGLAKP